MEIRSAINSMGLQQLDNLLATPIKIDFPVAALTQPEISWSQYSGSINLDDLPKLIKATFKRDYSENEEQQPIKNKCIRLLGQIDLCREVIKKVESLKTKILNRWKEKTFGKLGSYLNETRSTYSNTLKDLSQELDTQEKKVKYIYQESVREAQFNNFVNLFKNFQKAKEQTTYYFFSYDEGNFFENIFWDGNAFQSQDSHKLIDPYQVMDLPKNATPAEIKKKYHQLALELHPDKNSDDPRCKEKFQELNNAYEILKKKFQIS